MFMMLITKTTTEIKKMFSKIFMTLGKLKFKFRIFFKSSSGALLIEIEKMRQ